MESTCSMHFVPSLEDRRTGSEAFEEKSFRCKPSAEIAKFALVRAASVLEATHMREVRWREEHEEGTTVLSPLQYSGTPGTHQT